MKKTAFHKIAVDIDAASAFSETLRTRLGNEVFDRMGEPTLVYRDGFMIIPDDWIIEARSLEIESVATPR